MKIWMWGAALMICALMAVMACGTMTAAEQAERIQAVSKALESKHYTVSIQMMYPSRGGAKSVTSDYSLEVKGDTLVSYLPYIGRAYNVPYGGGKGLNFTAPIKHYEATKDNKGRTRVVILTDNEEDLITYYLEVWDTGQTTIDVQSREREPINYSGEVK